MGEHSEACCLSLKLSSILRDIGVFLARKTGVPDSNESACNMGNLGSVSMLGISFGEGNGYPLRNSYLENPVDRGAWWATVLGVAKN